jgi:FAD/FMN-containing dehydrogenase
MYGSWLVREPSTGELPYKCECMRAQTSTTGAWRGALWNPAEWRRAATVTAMRASPARFDAYVRGFRSALAPWLGSAAYVNYADASIANFGAAYWGSNYPRLQTVKRAYDPHNLFTFPQSVRLPGA